VAGVSAVRVKLDVGRPAEVNVRAEAWWADPRGPAGTDLAVITIPRDVTAERECEPALFGQISDCTAVLTVQAFGFPLFKLRADPADADQPGIIRDLEQVRGHAPVAANRRQGTLAVNLDDPPPSPPSPGESSPWAGMSGGPVWSAGRIVAVVAEHHIAEGMGRLTARRIDRAFDQLTASDLGVMVDLLGLPPTPGGLPDVVPVGPGQLKRLAYLAQVASIAPDELVDRENELGAWAEFCAGTAPYALWQAGPWSGKSALASWFVTHPPAGVDVVSFFISGRLIGQANGEVFLTAMTEQLIALDPAASNFPQMAAAPMGAWLSQLESAGALAEERGRRLVVVVDGLDEDEAGTTPSRGRPSIAHLLPGRPPPGVRFIVTSRPYPGFPEDLPGDHPLRTCAPLVLSRSDAAKDIEAQAKQELADLLAGDKSAVDVVGFIAGSGGGITRNDLLALTKAPPYKLDPILGGVSGRSLKAEPSTDSRAAPADQAARVYSFAHSTLRVLAEEQLGSELVDYRHKVHEWVGSYADDGWPDTTPGYAIGGYSSMLAATSDTTRLLALTRSVARHAFLLRATGSAYTTLTEIRAVQSLLADQDILNLSAIAELAARRSIISAGNVSIPEDLPVVWARLGRLDHAEALARAIANPDAQAHALTGVSALIAQGGDVDRAEELVESVTDQYKQANAMARLATVTAQAGDLDRAEVLARKIRFSSAQAEAYTGLSAVAARGGDPDRAEAFARSIIDPNAQARAMAGLATLIASGGDLDRAEVLAETIADPGFHLEALMGMIAVTTPPGDTDRGEARIRAISSAAGQAYVLAWMAPLIASYGELDRACRMADDAEALADTITDPALQVEVLAWLVPVIAMAGDLARAFQLADRADALTRAITDLDARAWALVPLVTAIAQAGDPARAQALAHGITNGPALSQLATSFARDGHTDMAEELVGTIPDPDVQALAFAEAVTEPGIRVQLLAALVSAAAAAGQLGRAHWLADRAEALSDTVSDLVGRARALTILASAVAVTSDTARASQLAGRAETLADTMADQADKASALTLLAGTLAVAGDAVGARRLADRAEGLILTLAEPDARARALAALVPVIAVTDDVDRAAAVADALVDHAHQASALTLLASTLAFAGDSAGACRLADRTEILIGALADPDARAHALATLVPVIARAGDPDRAEALADTIGDPAEQARALTALAATIAQVTNVRPANMSARALTEAAAKVQSGAESASTAEHATHLDRANRLIERAEAIANNLADPGEQAQAFTDLVAASGQAGDPRRAHQFADRAQNLAFAITDADVRASVLAGVAAAIAEACEVQDAELLLSRADIAARPAAEAFPCVYHSAGAQARAITDLAMIAAQAGDRPRFARLAAIAEALVRNVANSGTRPWMFAYLATAIARAGNPDYAEALANDLTDPADRANALTELASAAAQTGDSSRAQALADRAETLARSITYPMHWRATALADLAGAIAQAGNPERAETLADAIPEARWLPGAQADAYTELVSAAAQADDPDRFHRLAERAETAIRIIPDPDGTASRLATLAAAIAEAGDPDRAEAVADTIADTMAQAGAFNDLAIALAKSGNPGRALALADRAAALSDLITSPIVHARALANLATAFAAAGALDRALQAADRAEALTDVITDPSARVRELTTVAVAIAHAGDSDRAETLVDRIGEILPEPAQDQARAYTALAIQAAQAGDTRRTYRLADKAEALADTATHPFGRDLALAGLAKAIAVAGDLDRSEALADTISYSPYQGQEFLNLVQVTAGKGDLDKAEHLMARALVVAPEIWWIKTLARYFPSAIGNAWDLLAGAYTTGLDAPV
jgi:hypothetical protein